MYLQSSDEPYIPAIADQVAAKINTVVQEARVAEGCDAKTAMSCICAYDAAYLAWWSICREVYEMCEPLFNARAVCPATAIQTVETMFRALVVKLLTTHDPQRGLEWVENLAAEMLDRYISPNREGECFLGDPTAPESTDNRRN